MARDTLSFCLSRENVVIMHPFKHRRCPREVLEWDAVSPLCRSNTIFATEHALQADMLLPFDASSTPVKEGAMLTTEYLS